MRHMGRAPRAQDEFSRRVIEELFAAMPEGVSLREIGRRSSIDHSQLSRIKSGTRVLDVDQLEALASVAGVAPHVIVERAENGGGRVLDFPGKSGLSPSGSTVDESVERAALGHDVEAEIESQQDQP